jgi:hypothetical protein
LFLATFKLPEPTPLDRLTVRYAHPRGSLRVDHLWLNETDLFDLGARYQEVQPLVFENHYALPRFFPVYDWENLLPQDDPLVRLKNIDLGKTALIEEESPFSPRPPAVAESPANITVTQLRASGHIAVGNYASGRATRTRRDLLSGLEGLD